jgi:serine/threonine protein phosphatase 1
MKINIIGDIAGRYDELMLLLEKMPEADLIISVGDLVDRGPKSKEVIQWFMDTENADAVYGNHEDLFINGIVRRDTYNWMYNGGGATLRSYIELGPGEKIEDKTLNDVVVPPEHLQWVQTRPMYFEFDDLVISHAPITSLKNLPQDPLGRDHFFIWNRYEPSKPQGKYMIYGHNGKFKRHKWGDGSEFAMCIDNSHSGRLTGIHWPTKEIFSVDFLDREEHENYYHDIKAE